MLIWKRESQDMGEKGGGSVPFLSSIVTDSFMHFMRNLGEDHVSSCRDVVCAWW